MPSTSSGRPSTRRLRRVDTAKSLYDGLKLMSHSMAFKPPPAWGAEAGLIVAADGVLSVVRDPVLELVQLRLLPHDPENFATGAAPVIEWNDVPGGIDETISRADPAPVLDDLAEAPPVPAVRPSRPASLQGQRCGNARC